MIATPIPVPSQPLACARSALTAATTWSNDPVTLRSGETYATLECMAKFATSAPFIVTSRALRRGSSALVTAPSASSSAVDGEWRNCTMTSTGFSGSRLLRSGAIFAAISVSGSCLSVEVASRRDWFGASDFGGTLENKEEGAVFPSWLDNTLLVRRWSEAGPLSRDCDWE